MSVATATIGLTESGSLNAEDIYNFFMGKTEPDLMLSNVDVLEAKYKDETPAEKDARGARYKAAFAKYKDFFGSFVASMKESISGGKRSELRRMEEESRVLEAQELERLESMFDDL